MIIYCSENKIQNLLKEIQIKPNVFRSFFNFRFNGFHIGNESSLLSTDFSYEESQRTREFRAILTSLKLNGKLKELSSNTPIKQLSYIHSNGTLEYVKLKNGSTASRLSQDNLDEIRGLNEFFDDDELYFKIKICHERYDSIKFKCKAKTIEVFAGHKLHEVYKNLVQDDSIRMRHVSSVDPGIIYRKIPVEFIVWILDTDPNDRSIQGSPLIICC